MLGRRRMLCILIATLASELKISYVFALQIHTGAAVLTGDGTDGLSVELINAGVNCSTEWDSRAVDGHEQRRAVGSGDGADAAEAGFFVAADGARVCGRRIGLNSRNLGIAEQKFDELANQLRPQALTQAVRVGEELVDAANTGVALVGPPAVAHSSRNVGLDVANRDPVEIGEVRNRRRAVHRAREIFFADFIKRPASIPPLDDVRAIEPVGKRGKVGFGKRLEMQRHRLEDFLIITQTNAPVIDMVCV